jgi:hypothetical protein
LSLVPLFGLRLDRFLRKYVQGAFIDSAIFPTFRVRAQVHECSTIWNRPNDRAPLHFTETTGKSAVFDAMDDMQEKFGTWMDWNAIDE